MARLTRHSKTPASLNEQYKKLARTKGKRVRTAWLAWNKLMPGHRPDSVLSRSLTPRARKAQKRWKKAHDAWMGGIERAERMDRRRRAAHERGR